ncbi:MAG: FMN-binding protein [Eggerthellaceae bacterium]|nr:FMN-binding protein [Eggerthellaceae bacterium]
MQENAFKENILPVIVLSTICLIVTLALAITYKVSNPVIEANAIEYATAARTQVLAEADAFTEYEGALIDGVDELYIANNGAGVVATTAYKGFGGLVTTMVGIDGDGKITGVTVTEHAETPGLGTKITDPEYLKRYIGVTEAPANHINDDKNIDAVSGATITSNAVYGCVHLAFIQLDDYKEASHG